jgi:hypothetical protein
MTSMTLQLERRPNRTRRLRTSRWAWLAVLSAPILLFLTLVSIVQFHDPFEDWPRWGDGALQLAVYAPAIAGALLGLRSAWSGNHFGAHAAAVAIAWLTCWIVFVYLVTGPYDFEPPGIPLRLSASAAVLAAAAVEALYWLRWWRLRRGETPRTHRKGQH